MTRARATADTQDNNGGSVAPFVAGKNFIINGGFDFFQRGSFSQGSAGYALDRWRVDTGNTLTVTQQTTGAPVGSRYCMRVAFGATTYSDVMQFIETSQVAPLWGNTVTFQVKLRRNSTMGAELGFVIQKSATVDAGAGAAWTTIGSGTATNAQLPTGTGSSNWYQLTITASVPNDGTANSLRIIGGVTSAQASGAYWEMAQAQLEAGSVATPFSRAGGTIQGELAACQRYYIRYTGGSSAGANYQVSGSAISSTTVDNYFQLPVTMRAVPSSLDFSNLGVYRVNNGTVYNSGSWFLEVGNNGNTVSARYIHGSGVFTQGTDSTILVTGSNAASHVAFSAEL